MRQPEAASADKEINAVSEKDSSLTDHVEHDQASDDPNSAETGNLVYDDIDEEPEIHLRTWLAILSMFLLNFVQVFALQGPPAVLDFIGENLNDKPAQTWVPNSLSLVQAVISPLMSSVSDVFQARKPLLVGSCLISFVGSAIAPGSHSLGRLIAAQVLIGFGFAAVPLAYAVPSEVLPRKWRPLVQAAMNIAAALGAISGPLIIGAFTDGNINNWRDFFWIQFALWGLTAFGILFGYRPPKRHTRLDHLTWYQKVGKLDLPGFSLLTIGLTLFLVGLNLGGGLYAWGNARVVATLVVGLVILVCFALYEWKGTKTGILHHGLFQGGKNGGRTFAICVCLILVEAVLLFSYIIFYPVMSSALFTTNPFTLTTRSLPFWITTGLTTVVWGYWSSRFRTIRSPLFFGFLLYTGGIVGLATIQPGDGINQLCFAGLAGAGMGSPLVVIIAGVQLSTPHHLIATATAVTTSARAVGATVFTAIYAAAFSNRLKVKLPADVAAAAAQAGLPATSIMAFVSALADNDSAALGAVPGVTPSIIAAGVAALKQAFADSLRVVYIIAAPFGAVACIACFFLGDMKKTMTYRVDAPLEDLHAKNKPAKGSTDV